MSSVRTATSGGPRTLEGAAPAATGCREPVPVLDHDQALRTVDELSAIFAGGAAERDRERLLPFEEVALIKRSGLLGISVPAGYGGGDAPPSTVAAVFRRLAAGDPNLAQIVHSHFVYVNFTLQCASEEQKAAILRQVVAGRLLANAQAERGGRTAREVATRLLPGPGDGGLCLDGTKYYCTGTPFADLLAVLARLEDPEGHSGLPGGEHVVFVPANIPGVAPVDDWDGIGQRVTGSGSVLFDNVAVLPEWVVPRRVLDRANGYGAFAQLLHAAIDVGIAGAALADAVRFLTTRSRPWHEAGVERAEDDPLAIQRFGELSVELTAAEAVLDRAGRAVDAVFADPAEETATRASVDVASAKVLAEQASLRISSTLFEVCGTRSATRTDALDRHWRNARTHTLHDPARWKYQHLGRHLLTGQAPPRSASF
ncbi:MAG TPA: SfnB family sulfur acquisition oxidoreductase [Marmoricola sp.]